MLCSAVTCLLGLFGIASSAQTKSPPSVIVDTAKPVYFIPGKQVVLDCVATGEPPPRISWFFNGKAFHFNRQKTTHPIIISDSGSLTFHSITQQHQGRYQCRAKNRYGVSLSSHFVVKEAFIEDFQETEPTITRLPLGHATMLPCIPPNSQPRGKVSWTKTQNDGSETTIVDNSSERMTLDYEGNLYILTTRPEDSDCWFTCKVMNEVLQSSTQGPKHGLKLTGEYPVLKSAELFWRSQKDVMAVMYETTTLKCIMGGNPVPRIRWTHNDVDISSTGPFQISEDSFELAIIEFQQTEAGHYQCIGNNEIGDDVVEIFYVSAVQKPFWVSEPQDVSVPVEEDVTFRCEAGGIPLPVVTWFVNGLPLEESADLSDYVVNSKDVSLVLKNVERSDSTVIQCNASNPYGFVWADFFLNVVAEPPVIEGGPEPLVKAVKAVTGQTVSLPCKATGKPTPRRVWFRNDQIIKLGSRYTVSADGDLLFKIAGIKDRGFYSCLVRNKFGKDERRVKLSIQERTRIIVPPVDKFVTRGEDVSFHCEAVTDIHEWKNLQVFWLKDNRTLDVEAEEYAGRISVMHDGLVLHNVAVSDRGLYTCVATSSIDTAKATAQLKIKGPPDPPYDVHIKYCIPGRADVSWTFNKSLENYSPVRNFSMQYSTHHRLGKWLLAAESPHHRRQAAMRLAPWTEYTFRVAAVSDLGRGQYSEPTEDKCVTPMSRPFRNPRRIRKIANKTGFLTIEWARIPQDEHNGEGFYYNITIKEDGSKTYTSHIIDNYNITRIEIPVNTVFRPYSIMVSSGNVLGQSLKNPRLTKGYSGEAVPLAVPENFELDPSFAVSNTSVRVQWDPVNSGLAAIRGAFKGYQLSYWKTEEPDNKKGVRIPPNRTKPRKLKHTLRDLPPYSNISMDIAVLNTYFISNHSDVINFTTKEGVPGKVQYLFIQSRGSRFFLLEWKETEKKNGEIRGYQIAYKKQPSTSPMKVALTFYTPNITRAFLPGLEPDMLYKVAIWGFSQQGNGESYYMTALTMEEDLPLAVPRITKVVSGVWSFTVEWELDESVDARAASDYHLKYRRVGNGKWQRTTEEKATDFRHEITGLEPQATYYVVVVGEDDAGNVVSSKQSTVGTHPAEKPAASSSVEETTGSGNGTMEDYDFDDYEDINEPEFINKPTQTNNNVSSPATSTNKFTRMEETTSSLTSTLETYITSTLKREDISTSLLFSPASKPVSSTASTTILSETFNITLSASNNMTTSSFMKHKVLESTDKTTSKKEEIPVDPSIVTQVFTTASKTKQDWTTTGGFKLDLETSSTTQTSTVKEIKTTELVIKSSPQLTTSLPTESTRFSVGTVTLKPNDKFNHRAPALTGEESETIIVNSGEALDLTCAVQGNPIPSVTWLRLDVAVVSGENVVVITDRGIPDSRLIVLKTNEDSAGLYKCIAENYLGLVEQEFWIVLKEFPCTVVGSDSVVWTLCTTLLLFSLLSCLVF